MEPKVVNNHNRTANGFFLTSKSETEAKGEHIVYNYTVELLNAELKERHLRSANVLDNLVPLEEVVAEVTRKVMAICVPNGMPEDGIGAFVWLTAVGCMSAYHEKVKRMTHSAEMGHGGGHGSSGLGGRYDGRPMGQRPERFQDNRREHDDYDRLYDDRSPPHQTPYYGGGGRRRPVGPAGTGPAGSGGQEQQQRGQDQRGRQVPRNQQYNYDNGGRESRGPYYEAENRARSKSR